MTLTTRTLVSRSPPRLVVPRRWTALTLSTWLVSSSVPPETGDEDADVVEDGDVEDDE